MESAKALTMVSKVNYNATPVIYYQRYIGLSTGPSMVNARVLLMGSYRSTYGSAKRFTAIFNSYTPWLGGIIFSGPLWSPYLSLFLSYIWSREKCFNSKTPLGQTIFGYGNLIAGLIKGKVGWALDISTSRIVLNPKTKPSAMQIVGV